MIKIVSQLTDTLIKSLSSLEYPEKNIQLSPPNNPEFGDLSTNVALTLSKDLKQNPMNIGKAIIDNLSLPEDLIDEVTISQPGFINFKISNKYYYNILNEIIDNNKYGQGKSGENKTANVEFVSANPTGPLTIGHGRNAVLGDCIANILEWSGFNVTREYYYNDAGRQMRILGQSVEARYFELLDKEFKFPEDGYEGDYIIEIAKSIIGSHGKELIKDDSIFQSEAEKSIFEEIKETLKKIGISFDQFTNEKTFYDNGDIDQLLDDLKNKNLIYEKDDATWFKTTELGKEQDRVYIKSTGEPTYRLPDTAYHRDKVNREYDLIIDVFGADHLDTYPDVLLALNALGLNTDHIRVLLYQFVTLLRGGEKVKMSTRKATFVTLNELIKEVGSDVVRYFFIMRGVNSHLNFDLDLATDQSDKNPVYYLQYAHARICNIIKHGDSMGIKKKSKFDPTLLKHSSEITLLKRLEKFPEIIYNSHLSLEPHNLANFLNDIANCFHKFYAECRIISEDEKLTNSRVALTSATKIIIGNGLSILGLNAPEKM
jgi:arginyl-tRNA synthetase